MNTSISARRVSKNLVACSERAGRMGAKRKLSLSRIANLAKGLPRLLESQKRRKCDIGHKARHSSEKENTWSLERAGVFKGMAVILEERGFADARKLRAECKNFKCAPPALNCCCRRLLFNQQDFQDVNTILGAACEARGFQVIFLPKFHCELNFIEQCWGYAKRLYWLNPESSREDHLKRNALAALNAIPLMSMQWLVLQYILIIATTYRQWL